MQPELGLLIARRNYFSTHDVSRATIVEVEIAAPAKSPHAEDEFMCSFRLKSPISDRTETVYGVDALQALLLALGYLEAILHRLQSSSGLSLSWVGGEAQDFGIRIPKFSEEEPAVPSG
jgi:hypothetical protein